MKKIILKYNKQISIMFLLTIMFSCTDDLNLSPTNGISNDIQYSTVEGYKQSMATIYSTLAYDNFFRQYWNMQEITTDEAVSTWNDPEGISAYNKIEWSVDNSSVSYVYTTVMYNITLCNNFLIESAESKVGGRGFSSAEAESIATYAAEVRFLRAYYYWIMMDLYGKPPFTTPETLEAGEVPLQIQRADLFDHIESELKAIEDDLVEPKGNEYGRADQAACWALLARLYLNGEVYTGDTYYTEAVEYSKKVIDASYSLESNYNWLMLGDNDLNTNEFIFTTNYDNAKFTTWGGTNYLALGAAGVPQDINGMSGSWNSLRFPQSFPALFPSYDTLTDKRAAFWTDGQSLNVDNLGDYSQGYSTYKFRNLDRSGNKIPQNNEYNNISDIDFPVFRLAEMYLIYAEAVLRGGTGGDQSTALGYINKIRGRAYANDPNSTEGNISSTQLTLDFILDERARELYWESFRRTDLIRFNKFTSGDYVWAWKGGVKEGTGVNSKYKVFPIPATDKLSNPNLDQNEGY